MGLVFFIFLFFLPDVIITIYLIGREVLLDGHFFPLFPVFPQICCPNFSFMGGVAKEYKTKLGWGKKSVRSSPE
jgi:hypothetical protein